MSVHDLTVPDELENRLLQLFRYSQIGQCVNSVTHDVNNLLGAIMAYSELISMDESIAADSKRMLGEVVEAVRKASGLMGNLTDIARKPRQDVRIVAPIQLMNRVIDLRRYEISASRIQVETQAPDGLANLTVDLPRLEQALMYVLVNAIEALEDGDTRLIKVTSEEDGDAVMVRIWDSGAGPDADTQARMFDPFFTTKSGEHLGLGLSLARDTARAHDGDLVYDPDKGFCMTIPRVNPFSQLRKN